MSFTCSFFYLLSEMICRHSILCRRVKDVYRKLSFGHKSVHAQKRFMLMFEPVYKRDLQHGHHNITYFPKAIYHVIQVVKM